MTQSTTQAIHRGEFLRFHRINSGLKVREIAEQTGITTRCIEYAERGSNIGYENFIKIANALKIEDSILLPFIAENRKINTK